MSACYRYNGVLLKCHGLLGPCSQLNCLFYDKASQQDPCLLDSADLRTRDTIVFGAFVKADPSGEPLSSVDTIYRGVKFCL